MPELGKLNSDVQFVARRSRLGYAQSCGVPLEDISYMNEILKDTLNGEVLSELAERQRSLQFLLLMVVVLCRVQIQGLLLPAADLLAIEHPRVGLTITLEV